MSLHNQTEEIKGPYSTQGSRSAGWHQTWAWQGVQRPLVFRSTPSTTMHTQSWPLSALGAAGLQLLCKAWSCWVISKRKQAALLSEALCILQFYLPWGLASSILPGAQCLCQPVPFQCFSKTLDMHEKCNPIYCCSNLASKFHFIFK